MSPLTSARAPRRAAGRTAGAALAIARKAKERTYPELRHSARCKLVVLAFELGGRWSPETATFVTKASREGASFITSQSELGVIKGGCGGGGGGGQNSWVFSAIPHLELGKTPLPKGLVLGQISVLWGKWLFRRPREKQASSDAADAGLGVSADAGRIMATLSGRVG